MTDMHSAEIQQRNDAREMLPIARNELNEYIKLYQRLENNSRVFVDRTNHELAALALAIRQKQENVSGLEKMANGHFVEPTAPVASRLQTEAAANQDGKSNGTSTATTATPFANAAAAEAKSPEAP